MEYSTRRKEMVESLYSGPAAGETETVSALLAADLEWWFHGPPGCEHMMRILTGSADQEAPHFRFEPKRVAEVGKWVVAEGWEGDSAYWVHVWEVEEGGLITRFREYFNTWVTVRELGPPPAPAVQGWTGRRSGGDGPTVWQSEARGRNGRSLPGLLLAI